MENRKKKIREFIIENPRATSKDIKEKLHIKIMKVYAGGMAEAFQDAGVSAPRTFKRKTFEEKKKILIDFVRANPNAGGHVIRKETKIDFLTVFKNTEQLFQAANVPYRKKNNLLFKNRSQERKQVLIDAIRKNPFIGVNELMKSTRVSIYRHFGSVVDLYNEANVPYFGKGIRKRNFKQGLVIEFIKNNNFATQREINKVCNTHVQILFKEGIFEAYEKAGIPFPFERIKLHGVTIGNIKNQASIFEEEIAKKLGGYGRVNRLVKTKRGFADVILERNDKKVVVEIKNYKSHEISISQIKQLNKYLEDIGSNLGFLICLKKPRRDSFLMGENKIFVLMDSELSKIPEIMDLSYNG